MVMGGVVRLAGNSVLCAMQRSLPVENCLKTGAAKRLTGGGFDHRRTLYNGLRPEIMLSKITTMAITSKMWMKPPIVYEVTIPSSQRMRGNQQLCTAWLGILVNVGCRTGTCRVAARFVWCKVPVVSRRTSF